MSKYWRKTVTGDYSRLFKNWQTDISLAPKTEMIMGRIKGTNRSLAVLWDEDEQTWRSTNGPVTICQWITFADFADIRACVWRQA